MAQLCYTNTRNVLVVFCNRNYHIAVSSSQLQSMKLCFSPLVSHGAFFTLTLSETFTEIERESDFVSREMRVN